MSSRVTPAVAFAFLGCVSVQDLPAARFANRRPVEVVNDRRDVAQPPKATTNYSQMDAYDAAIQRPIERTLELPRDKRALGVNALDEVPDSTWFTNRITRRELSADEIRTGPLTIESPELFKPWVVTSSKIGGTEEGFIIRDTRGLKFLIKFDSPQFPELVTGTHVVVNRLLWAAGYNVPEDQIAFVTLEELRLAPDAVVKDGFGKTMRPLKHDSFLRHIGKVWHEPDGRIRVMISRWLDGTALGSPPEAGVREGDINDRIPHEGRRDLRGAYPIFAWLDHVDTIAGNFLDMWVNDPVDPRRHYVKHYLVDFGKSLGAMGSTDNDRRRGYAYRISVPNMFRELVVLGLDDRIWEKAQAPRIRGVAGWFVASTFDPGDWHPDYPFIPFDTADRFDKYWGTKIVQSFSRAQIAAAVEAGRFSDPRAAAYIVDTLVARQRATAAYWFRRVNPVDNFTVDAHGALCFDDLAIQHNFARSNLTHYSIVRRTRGGNVLGPATDIVATVGGRTCTQPIGLAPSDNDGYTIVELTTTRPTFRRTTYVHLARRGIAMNHGEDEHPQEVSTHVIGVYRI